MKRKFFRCAKGAISLFLILLLLPFTQIATILVSAQRYNSSVAILDEVMDSSSLSTLSDYDGYLRDRFGLFAISQKSDLKSNYESYFNYNCDGVLKNAFNDDLEIDVNGGLSLKDDDILLSQIKEYNKLNAPIKMIHDGLDLSELIKKFEKKFNLSNILDMTNAGIDICDGALDFRESYEKLNNLSDRLSTLKNDYNTKFNEFSAAIGDIYEVRDEIAELEEEETTLNSELTRLNEQLDSLNNELEKEKDSKKKEEIRDQIDKIEEKIEKKEKELKDNQEENRKNNNKIQPLINAFNAKKTAYANSHDELISKLSSYKSEMKTALSKIESMVSSTGEFLTTAGNAISSEKVKQAKNDNEVIDKKLKEYDGGKAKDDKYYELVFQKSDNDSVISENDMIKGMNAGLNDANSEIAKLTNEAKEAFDEKAIQDTIDQLTNQKSTVSKLSVDDVKNKKDGNDYYTEINVVLNREQLKQLYLYFEDMSNDIGVSLSDIWESIKAFLESIFKVKLVYDPALCSNIDSSYFMDQFGIKIDNPATNPVAALIQAISEFITGLADFTAGVGTFNFVKAWKGIKGLFNGFKNIVTSLVNVVTQLVSNVATYIKEPSQMLLPYYFTQTLPCRTDYKTGKNMTGNGYTKIEYTNYGNSGVNGLPAIESITSLFNLAFGEKEANDKMFCGAELEYIISGKSSEIENQSSVFGMLYIIRLLLDIPGWGKAYELQGLAAGPHYGIVLAIYLLLEPFLDCVLLVNGEKVDLIKTTPYLSAAGMTEYIPKIMTIVPTDSTSEANMRNKFSRIFVKAGESQDDFNYSYDKEAVTNGSKGDSSFLKDLLKLNYKEYLMLLMLLFSNHNAELNLFKNIIQMETSAYYTKNLKSDFDFKKAYTQINCTVSGSASPLLATAFSDSIFKFSRQQCRGY